MAHAGAARVARTALLTVGAVVLDIAIGNGWVPLSGIESSALQAIAAVVVLLVMFCLPLYNLKLAVLDGRVLESSGSWSVMQVFRWLITLANVILNFILIAFAFFFATMFISGAAVA